MLCLETRLVFRLLEGVIHGLEALIVGDVFDKRLDFPQTCFNAFQFLAGTVIGAVNILDLLLKIGVLKQVVFREIVECPRRFLEDRELGFILIALAVDKSDPLLNISDERDALRYGLSLASSGRPSGNPLLDAFLGVVLSDGLRTSKPLLSFSAKGDIFAGLDFITGFLHEPQKIIVYVRRDKMKYCFYYDESEHSRVINLSTVTGETYYDGFLAAIIGWRSDHETAFEQRYHAFEEKYADRKKKGELKSGTIKPKQLVHGLASLNEANVKLLGDFFSIFDENSYIYLFCASKIEYVITQIFKGYRNSVFFDMDAARYSIVKAIVTYRPTEVIESLYKSPAEFVAALMTFLTNRIRRNKENRELKAQENTAFEAVLYVLNNVDVPQSLTWDYHSQFVGFGNFLSSKGILDYSVLLDKEGEAGAESKTLIAAKEASLKNCEEADSIDHFGIRMADMLVGIIGKLMKSLYHSLTPTQDSPRIAKTLLSKEWFRLTDGQLQLYKQLYHIVFEINNDWYKVYAGNYSDDLLSFLGLLDFMNLFNSAKDIEQDFDMQPEYCNSCICQRLETHFEQMKNKLPVEPVKDQEKDFFRNRRGAKVYHDVDRQPILELTKGKNAFVVLSVGIAKGGIPLVTVEASPENLCYRLPVQLNEWAMTLVSMANTGEDLFPAEVIFTKAENHIYADII